MSTRKCITLGEKKKAWGFGEGIEQEYSFPFRVMA
jgi:hypothetical protein